MYKKIKTYLAEDWTSFEKRFESSLDTDIEMMQQINSYLLSHRGKQLRPVLCLLTAKALGADVNMKVTICAVAAEILHMATLLHDDVADESSTRRGDSTVGALYSPNAAVLVGDFWLSRAIRDITGYCGSETLLSFARCLENLAEGEIFQMSKSESLDTTLEDYKKIIYCKTASLFITSVLSGAYSIDANQDDCRRMEEYAYHLGLSFQMMDDIFDYDIKVKSGKPAYQDIAEHKMTIPFIGAAMKASQEDLSKAKEALKDGKVDEVVSFVNKYNGISYAYDALNDEINAAKDAISDIPHSDAKKYLLEIAESMASRRV